ncbi:MAG: hypothetical protein D6733_03070 [Methanobacteriota archaeon]|nr:MAG: hypothetical protein D6733_03070 [Euryarchaeota archaeon]
MADYQGALNTSLGDYLSYRASREGTSRKKLEKDLEIAPIRVEGDAVFYDPRDKAIKRFNAVAAEYDVVVELQEGFANFGIWQFFLYKKYVISGTGIKANRKGPSGR